MLCIKEKKSTEDKTQQYVATGSLNITIGWSVN